jgi:hypothetical protein
MLLVLGVRVSSRMNPIAVSILLRIPTKSVTVIVTKLSERNQGEEYRRQGMNTIAEVKLYLHILRQIENMHHRQNVLTRNQFRGNTIGQDHRGPSGSASLHDQIQRSNPAIKSSTPPILMSRYWLDCRKFIIQLQRCHHDTSSSSVYISRICARQHSDRKLHFNTRRHVELALDHELVRPLHEGRTRCSRALGKQPQLAHERERQYLVLVIASPHTGYLGLANTHGALNFSTPWPREVDDLVELQRYARHVHGRPVVDRRLHE